MRERIGFVGPFAALAGAVGLCCGLPVLLSLGVLGTAAGMSLGSWALVGLGLVVAVAGWTRRVRRRSGADAGGATAAAHHHPTPDHPTRDAHEETPR